jgi:SAM-dependent methyltransferase
MKLSDKVKQQIIDILDSEEFMSTLYEGLADDKRNSLGQFYTPGKICIEMIEQFSCDTLAGRNILDPTCGSGNLLIACLIAGANVDKLYGNDYDPEVVPLCVKRINRACEILNKPYINDWQIHQGDALDSFSLTYFGPDYAEKLEEHFYEINRGGYAFSLFDALTDSQQKAMAAVRQAIENTNKMLAPIRTEMERIQESLAEPRELMKQVSDSIHKVLEGVK